MKTLIYIIIFSLIFSINTASSTESPVQQTVMVFGDDLSSGFKIQEGKNWVSLLQQCIINMHEDVLIINESVNNDTTQSGIKRLSSALEAYQPDVIIIALGTNDQLTNINNKQTIDNLNKMIDLSQQHDAQILLVGSPLVDTEQPGYFKEIALQKKIPLVNNLYMELEENTSELYIDELHASTLAQQTIMNTIWKQLFPILGI